MRITVVGVVAIAALSTVMACAATSQPDPTTSLVEESQLFVQAGPDAALYPTVEFFGGRMTAPEIYNMVEESIAACMESHGWEYSPVLQDTPGEQRTVGELETFRQTYGYSHYSRPPSSDRAKSAIEQNQIYFEGLSPEDRHAYALDIGDESTDPVAGVPPEGREAPPGSCRAMAQEATGLPLYDEEVMERMRELYVSSFDSPELAAARLAYSACMRLLGYDVNLPSDADALAMSAGAGLSHRDAVEQEIEISLADLGCQRSTILPTSQAIERRVVDILLSEFPRYRD